MHIWVCLTEVTEFKGETLRSCLQFAKNSFEVTAQQKKKFKCMSILHINPLY